MIAYVLDAVKASGVCDNPIIVVGQKKEMVMEALNALGPNYTYAMQDEQLGTGHAVLQAKEVVPADAKNVMVLYCDQPLMSAETIKKLHDVHVEQNATLTMATTEVPHFDNWCAAFSGFSRIIRDGEGKIDRTVENKDATDEERLIREVNPCYLCFKADWLWNHLTKINNENAQGEYYLTDLIHLACSEGNITSVGIDPKEALGANTQEQLQVLEEMM